MYEKFETLLGKTLTDIKVIEQKEIHFYTEDEHFVLNHFRECCEQVYIESIVGDLDDLIGSPLTLAEEASNRRDSTDDEKLLLALMGPLMEDDESYTWTFYKLANINGYVDIRWYGSSNGFYSESVDFNKLEH